jgi:hypothetical protein
MGPATAGMQMPAVASRVTPNPLYDLANRRQKITKKFFNSPVFSDARLLLAGTWRCSLA